MYVLVSIGCRASTAGASGHSLLACQCLMNTSAIPAYQRGTTGCQDVIMGDQHAEDVFLHLIGDKQCETCGKWFTPNPIGQLVEKARPLSRYCSTRCLWNALESTVGKWTNDRQG